LSALIGIVANPKLKRPLLVEAIAQEVNVYRLGYENTEVISTRKESAEQKPWKRAGNGYYDVDNEATRLSGFLRVHTPTGVVPRGAGYGTALYTGLLVGAVIDDFIADVDPTMSEMNHLPGGSWPGISSKPGTRSKDAEDWWEASIHRGLASRECAEVEEDPDEPEDCSEIDLYPLRTALRFKLIPASFVFHHNQFRDTSASWNTLWREVREHPEAINRVEPKALLALDVRGLTLGAINLLGVLGIHAGMPEADLDSMRLRWELNLDPSQEIAQMRLPFKPNSSEARRAEAALGRADEARAAVGWDRLEDLP